MCFQSFSGNFQTASQSELDFNADLTPASNTYCSVFSDSEECEQQKEESEHKYWTSAQVRKELWDTMKGLAELETRENEHYRERFEKKVQRKRVFELFRKTMAQEITEVHRLQAQTSTKHTAAFRNLSSQLLIAASLLKNYTDSGLSDVNNKVTRLSEKQENDYEGTLALIRRRVSEIYVHMDQLHAESARNISEVQRYSERVEAEMRRQDADLLARVGALASRAEDLQAAEAGHYRLLSAAEAESAAREANDTAGLDRDVVEGFARAEREQRTRVEAQRERLRAAMSAGFENLTERFDEERNRSDAAARSVRDRVGEMASDRLRASEQRDRELAAARAALDALESDARRRLAVLEARADGLNGTLAAAASRLGRAVAAAAAELRARLEANMSSLDTAAAVLGERVEGEDRALTAAVNSSAAEVRGFSASFVARQRADAARLEAGIRDAASGLNASLEATILRDREAVGRGMAAEQSARARSAEGLAAALAASNGSLWARLRAAEARQAGADDSRSRQMGSAETALAVLREGAARWFAALSANSSATADALERDRSRLAAEEGADSRKAAEHLAAGIERVHRNLTDAIDRDTAADRARADAAQADERARIMALATNASLEQAALREEIERVAAGEHRLDNILEGNMSALSKKLAELEGLLGGQARTVSDRLDRAESDLGAEFRSAEDERARDEAALARELTEEVSAVRAHAEQQLGAVSQGLSSNLSAASASLLAGIASVRALMSNSTERLTGELAAWGHTQVKQNTDELHELNFLKSKAASAALGFANQSAYLEHKLALLAKDISQERDDLSGRIASGHREVTDALNQDYKIVDDRSQAILKEQHLQMVKDLHDHLRGVESQMQASVSRIDRLISGLDYNLSDSTAHEHIDNEDIWRSLRAFGNSEDKFSKSFATETKQLSDNSTRLLDTLHISAAALRMLLKTELNDLENKMNGTYSSLENKLMNEAGTVELQDKQAISDAVLQTNGRIYHMRNDSANLIKSLAAEIFDARRTELQHDKNQYAQISQAREEQLEDKQVVDALMRKLQRDLEATKSQLDEAKQSILFRESEDNAEMKHMIATGMQNAYVNATLAYQELRASTHLDLQEAIYKQSPSPRTPQN